MRLTTIILIMAIMQVSASTFAQRITLSEKNATLNKIFDRISDQSGYDFVFTSDLLKGTRPVTIHVKNTELDQVLMQIFANQPVSFSIENKTVVIRAKEKGFFENLMANFRAITVRGKVLDEKGQPLVGATVAIKGTKRVVRTDRNGVFYLENVGAGDKLLISYVGYQTREVDAVADLGSLTMAVADAKLQEVTVNAGYYTVKEGERTGNISRITAKDIEAQPVTNVLATMQGRMAGVNITQQTGAPGGGFDIRIRGQNSLRPEANSPLYVIDGVPYASDPIGQSQTSTPYPTSSSPLNSISPENIESIEVLKDADATSIYGSRGANGVVLISTKKGKAGKTAFNITGAKGAGRATRFVELMNTEEYLAMRRQAFINDGLTAYGPRDYDINGTWDQTRYTDWKKEILGGTAQTTDVRGSVSGGSERTQFLLGGSYHQESTVYKGDSRYKRGGAMLNINHTSEDSRFRASFSGSYNSQDNNLPAYDMSGETLRLAPNAPALYKADGSLNWENNTWQNPLRNLNARFKSKTKDLIANMVLSYEIINGLTLKSSLGFTDLNTIETRTRPSTIFNPAANITSARSAVFFNDTERSSWIIEPQINYERMVAGGKLDILFGTSFQNQVTSTLYQNGFDFSSNTLIYNLAAAKSVTITNNDETRYKYQALFARVNYNWQQRYILNLTARRDGSSRFGPGRQFGTFGAVGAAWIFTREDFFKESRWLSSGKLRASYGTTGNDQIGDYQYLDTYSTSGINYGGTTGLQPSRLFNPDFGWEVNKKLELALELGFLQDRITASASWYRNRSSSQLVGIPLPGITGFSVLQANVDAEVENRGLELTLGTVNFNRKDFRWSTNLNISFNRNKLLSYPGLESSPYKYTYMVGQPLNINILFQYKGINPQTGVYEFEDFNKDGNVSFVEDAKAIADLNPKFFGGLQNQFSYKRWNLDFLFQFVKQKTKLFDMGGAGMMINVQQRLTDTWTKPGDNAAHQIATTGYNYDALVAQEYYGASDAMVTDGSYIRLKNIALSYELPLGRQNRSCKIMLQGQNLLTLTRYEDGDPEYGFAAYLAPLKVISAGIQLTF